MSPKKAKVEAIVTRPKGQSARPFGFDRGALAEYLRHPETFGTERVIYYNDKFVVINDLFPKSVVHRLVMSRNFDTNTLHPFNALDDAEYLTELRAEVAHAKDMVAAELRRRYGKYSATDKARIAALESEETELPDTLPEGRDWSLDVMCGFHGRPSMTHQHVHVLSRDMMGSGMKKSSHYQSFNTPFFVKLDDFPIDIADPRRDPDAGFFDEIDKNLVCCRCGQDFGNKITALKAHLEQEFEEWKTM